MHRVALARELIALAMVVPMVAACTTEPTRSAESTTTSVPITATAASAVPSTVPSTAAATATTTDPNVPCVGATANSVPVQQVVWIVMENHTRQQVLDDLAAPYVPALARACATASDYHSVGSPSLPNYMGATSGSTYHIGDDNPPSAHPLTGDNLFRQVRVSGRRAVSYEESMPRPCALTGSGRYAVRHNPATYYSRLDDRDACTSDDVPLGSPDSGALADTIDADALPAFTFITPDLCNDTHDCSVATGDAWLARWVPRLLASAPYRRGTMVLFVVWDEPSPMPFLAVTATITPGTVVAGTVDHFALLRTTESLLGLPLLGAAQQATDMRAALGR